MGIVGIDVEDDFLFFIFLIFLIISMDEQVINFCLGVYGGLIWRSDFIY